MQNFPDCLPKLVLKVQNDILRAVDDNKSVILLLLDLSSAFDTVDHLILLSRLSHRFGIKGNALAWFDSYLKSRKQFVQIEDCQSSQRCLAHGVPQGSVLGPLLYLLYTSPIADIINFLSLQYHLYADDSQLYISFKTLVRVIGIRLFLIKGKRKYTKLGCVTWAKKNFFFTLIY